MTQLITGAVTIQDPLAHQTKRIRIALGLTQTQLARRSQISINTICHYETGIRNPSLEKVRIMLDVLGYELRIVRKGT